MSVGGSRRRTKRQQTRRVHGGSNGGGSSSSMMEAARSGHSTGMKRHQAPPAPSRLGAVARVGVTGGVPVVWGATGGVRNGERAAAESGRTIHPAGQRAARRK